MLIKSSFEPFFSHLQHKLPKVLSTPHCLTAKHTFHTALAKHYTLEVKVNGVACILLLNKSLVDCMSEEPSLQMYSPHITGLELCPPLCCCAFQCEGMKWIVAVEDYTLFRLSRVLAVLSQWTSEHSVGNWALVGQPCVVFDKHHQDNLATCELLAWLKD